MSHLRRGWARYNAHIDTRHKQLVLASVWLDVDAIKSLKPTGNISFSCLSFSLSRRASPNMDDGSETCCSAAQNLQSTRAITSQPLKEKSLFWQTITKRERQMTSTIFDGRQILRVFLKQVIEKITSEVRGNAAFLCAGSQAAMAPSPAQMWHPVTRRLYFVRYGHVQTALLICSAMLHCATAFCLAAGGCMKRYKNRSEIMARRECRECCR